MQNLFYAYLRQIPINKYFEHKGVLLHISKNITLFTNNFSVSGRVNFPQWTENTTLKKLTCQESSISFITNNNSKLTELKLRTRVRSFSIHCGTIETCSSNPRSDETGPGSYLNSLPFEPSTRVSGFRAYFSIEKQSLLDVSLFMSIVEIYNYCIVIYWDL